MKIGKRKISHALLSDQETMIIVVSPNMEQFAAFLDSLAVIPQLGEAFQKVANMGSGISVPYQAMGKLDQKMLNDFYPLVSALSRITTKTIVGENLENLNRELLEKMPPLALDDFKQFDPLDGIAVILCYINLLAPESLTNPTEAETAIPAPQELPQSVS